MPIHFKDFLRLTSLLAVFAGLATVGTLQGDENQAEAVSTRRPPAEKHAEAVKKEKRRFAAQQLVKLETELEGLMERVTSNHPRVKQVEGQIRDEIQRAVEDTRRNVHHMQREFELRFREIEQAFKHHVRDAERFVEEHSGELEEVIEDIDRHVERRIGELEERLDNLNEHFEHEDHGDDEDEEHDHHHHSDHEHDHDDEDDKE